VLANRKAGGTSYGCSELGVLSQLQGCAEKLNSSWWGFSKGPGFFSPSAQLIKRCGRGKGKM